MTGGFFSRFARPSALRAAGVLSMNRRNREFIMKYNARRFYPMVDDKSLTKRLALEIGIPCAGHIGEIRFQHEIHELPDLIQNASDGFVIKPGHGSGGRGILVIRRYGNGVAYKNDGTPVEMSRLSSHISAILSGLYSLGGQTDYALLEERIEFSSSLRDYSVLGVPDVRIIVFRGYPAMAMIRLATKQSDGRANLHQGAVGVGLDLSTGRPLGAVCRGQMIERHPDTGKLLADLRIPRWDEHLELASKCAEMVELGYFGADIVCDASDRPLMLELNARPGLAIQIANQCGLANRLDVLEQLPRNAGTARERVRTAKDRFRESFENPGNG